MRHATAYSGGRRPCTAATARILSICSHMPTLSRPFCSLIFVGVVAVRGLTVDFVGTYAKSWAVDANAHSTSHC